MYGQRGSMGAHAHGFVRMSGIRKCPDDETPTFDHVDLVMTVDNGLWRPTAEHVLRVRDSLDLRAPLIRTNP